MPLDTEIAQSSNGSLAPDFGAIEIHVRGSLQKVDLGTAIEEFDPKAALTEELRKDMYLSAPHTATFFLRGGYVEIDGTGAVTEKGNWVTSCDWAVKIREWEICADKQWRDASFEVLCSSPCLLNGVPGISLDRVLCFDDEGGKLCEYNNFGYRYKEVEIARLSDGALAPRFMAIAMNETDSWNENAEGYDRAIALSGGAIFATYFYNARSITNLCEIMASYELHRVDTIGNIRSSHSDERYEATEEDREWLDEWLANAEHDSIIDVHCNVIDGIALEYGRHQLIEDLATRPLEELQELDTEGAIDEMTERQSGNPTIC